ncbi:MAG TPA: RNHCP domain-containing protein [Clostridia bacterium]|nr:RNHCP domain-containing protein [Clostridia bacterium]
MGRKDENCSFTCENCGKDVLPLTNGSYRNHCPFCLYSKHVDNVPGDRLCKCKGLMKPIGLGYKAGKGYQVVHMCTKCGAKRVNKIAESTLQADDIEQLLSFGNSNWVV